MMENLKQLYKKQYGVLPLRISLLTGGGSERKYYRIIGESGSVIGVEGYQTDENKTFLRLCDCLRNNEIKVPEVLEVSEDFKFYLLDDLGDKLLIEALNAPDKAEKIQLGERALKNLVKIQRLSEEVWGDKVGFPEFSERLVRWDLNYFKYCFLKTYGVKFDESLLEDDFDRLVSNLLSEEIDKGFMYRDFQSRNIMLKDGEMYFIDFQGARKGPMAYDAISFIWQAKAPFTFKEREELEEYYISLLVENRDNQSRNSSAEREGEARIENLKKQMRLMLVFRTLQVLGAYGFRGLIERKPHFLESIPKALENLRYLREIGSLKEYPELDLIAQRLSSNDEATIENVNKGSGNENKESALNQEKKNSDNAMGQEKSKLVVSVFSFSYKRGYPEDSTGNGGGFMFDCRAIHNPGRYEEYKKLTGRNKEVIEFLEKGTETGVSEAISFVDNAIRIVKPSIDRYISRGFTSLQVGFGCTGGQHRSVYCAERFAGKIKEMYPQIEVKLQHNEEENWP